MISKYISKILESDLWFRIFKQDRPQFRVEGSCKQTGNCCKNLILVNGRSPIRTIREFNRIKKRISHYSMFIPKAEPGKDGLLRFSCSNLGGDNRCKIYEDRPNMCRRYPDPNVLSRGKGGLLPGCGYHLIPLNNFEDSLKKAKVKLKIID